MNYNINTSKNDLVHNNKLIIFNHINNKLKKIISNELLSFFNKYNISKNSHILVVGIGNDNYTADSIGPKVLKHIKVNSYLEVMGYIIKKTKVSALEPGVLGETGIRTSMTIKSVANEIKPDLVLIIDSLVSNNIDYINKCIEITDRGLNSNNGLSELDFDINKETLGLPVILIGVVTSVLVNFKNNNKEYILSTKDVDKYVNDISIIIGASINKAIKKLG